MQKHLSRRELTRRMEQGREAMRVLAAAVVQAGGTIRIARNTFESLPPGHKMDVEREALTGDLIVRAGVPAILREQEMTFDEIRAKYAEAPVPGGADADGHNDSNEREEKRGEPSPEPAD